VRVSRRLPPAPPTFLPRITSEYTVLTNRTHKIERFRWYFIDQAHACHYYCKYTWVYKRCSDKSRGGRKTKSTQNRKRETQSSQENRAWRKPGTDWLVRWPPPSPEYTRRTSRANAAEARGWRTRAYGNIEASLAHFSAREPIIDIYQLSLREAIEAMTWARPWHS
jgi:hypothetical protein